MYLTNVAAPGDLFTVSFDAGSPVQLDIGPGAGDARDFKVSPDSVHTVYRSGPNLAQIDLFSVATKGGTPTKLNTGFISTDFEYQITPDSRYVVYLQRNGLAFDLFSVLIGGGVAPTQLNIAPGNQNAVQFHVSPNSQWVAYRAEPSTGFGNLFTVPTAGGTPVQLNVGIAAGSIALFQFSADSQTVVHGVHGHNPSTFNIYSVPVAGGPHIKLNVGDGGADPWWFFVSPTADYVVYTAELGNFVFDLFTVPMSGGDAIKLNVGPGAGNVFVSLVKFTPDGSTVLYRVDRGSGRYDLFSVPIFGGTPIKMNAGLTDGVRADYLSSPNGQYVAFRVLGDTTLYLYATPIVGGVPTRLNAVGQRVESFVISPDSSRVLYKTQGPASDLFSVSVELSETARSLTVRAASALPFTGSEPVPLLVLAILIGVVGFGLTFIARRTPRHR